MSYDLIIAPKTPSDDWAGVLTRLESHAENPTSLSQSMRSKWDQVADRLVTFGYERFDESDYIELDHSEHGIQLTMLEHEAGLSVPYWYEDAEADRVLRLVGEAIRVVRDVSGWSVYDPQLDREIDSVDDIVEEARGVISSTTRQLVEMASSTQAAGPGSGDQQRELKAPSSERKSRPWWKFW